MKVTQFANFANNATKQVLGVTGLQRENLQSMFSYPDAINVSDLVTVSGDVITIRDGAPINAKQVTVNIEPLQSGTGNPSPTNRRPISGWGGIIITQTGSEPNQTKEYNIVFPSGIGIIYGGILNVTDGSLSADRIKLKLGDFTNWNWHTSTNSYTASRTTSSPFPQLKQGNIVCEIAPYVERSQLPSTSIAISISVSGTSIFLKDNIHSGADGLTDFVNSIRDIDAVFYIESPQIYHITPTNILLYDGLNTIYANCGSMEMEYYSKEMEG